MEIGAMVEDARMGIAHWRDWGRIAVVTDSGLLRDAIGFFALMFHHPFRLFFNADYGKAKAWIEERRNEQAA
ncbi:MAG TPA: STAS/SEC14 domain-containing protein [Rhizomicrobium sp.]|nr:STAS/SEC14 domain-containing protein [Rhizomicrobium sp.]